MFTLAILFFVLVYVAISVLVVLFARRWARKHGRSPIKAGWLAALVMYLLVAWEQIPTYVLHKYYCATKVGYWVYKTPEQWKAENPGVAETLHATGPGVRWYELAKHRGIGVILNERFAQEKRVYASPMLPVSVVHYVVIDRSTGEVMARSTHVSSGYGQMALGGNNSWRFWVGAETCWPKESKIGVIETEFQNINGEPK